MTVHSICSFGLFRSAGSPARKKTVPQPGVVFPITDPDPQRPRNAGLTRGVPDLTGRGGDRGVYLSGGRQAVVVFRSESGVGGCGAEAGVS